MHSRRLFIKYNVLVVLYGIQMVTSFIFERVKDEIILCEFDEDIGVKWRVKSPVGVLMFITHVMPSMFCAAMPRSVFTRLYGTLSRIDSTENIKSALRKSVELRTLE
jgi:hypothetical protein